jgi:protein-S-isoprenylcysteine O-methyltransferase Ste14
LDPVDVWSAYGILTSIVGKYGRNWGPTLLFTLGRAATGPVQYWLTQRHPLGIFGIPKPPTGGTIEILGRTFPKLPFLTALMPGVLSAKHILWMNTYLREPFTWEFAFFGVIADIIYESITTIVFTTAAKNPMYNEKLFYIGFTLYISSVALELAAELQRAAFKRDPKNAGKPCTTGFWGITRHINYTANVLFGFGYGLAAGGPVYACMTAGMYLANFVTNAMPSIESYCKVRYGKEWEKYERDVPYQLIPGIY